MSVIRYGVIFILVLYGVYKIFVQNIFVMRRRLDSVRESTSSERMLDEDTGKIEKYIKSGKLYKIPVLGPFYEKQIDSLVSANIPMKPKEYLLATIVVFIILFLIGSVTTGQLIIGFVLGTIGLILPSFYVGHLKGKRRVDLNEQLPEFLNTLGNGLRSGLSLNQSIGIATQEAPDPVGWEFNRVLSDMNMGRTVEVSLNNLKERTKNESIDLLVNAIIIQREAGGNLSEILDLLADTIRENAKLQRYFKSTVSQNKLSGMIIGFLPIGLAAVLTVMTPDYMMPLFMEPMGRIMLIGAVLMMGTGMFIIKKITDLEV